MALLAGAWASAPARGQAVAPGADPPAVGREVVRRVADAFYDPARADAWVKAHSGFADAISDPRAFHSAANGVLARLGASHTRLYAADEVEYYGLVAIFARSLAVKEPAYDGIGVDTFDRRFVRVVHDGGPGSVVGLRRGDEIVAADGRPFEPIGSFRGRSGVAVRLTVRRKADAPTFEVLVTPRSITPTREWAESQEKGAKLVRRGDRSIGVVRLFAATGDRPKEMLRDQFQEAFRTADAVVIDLRDGWGGANPDFVDLFSPLPPRLTFVERDGTRREYDPPWRKPAVLLVNGGTRSGKEVVAHAFQSRKLGPVVGERTAGAVLAGKPFLLADGSVLFLAVADVLVDGRKLEGVGVTPDIEVPAPLPYADGADPQLDAALDAAARACGAK